MIHLDIRRSYVVKEPQTTVGRSEPAILDNLGRYILRTFRVEATIICSVMKYSGDFKMFDFE